MPSKKRKHKVVGNERVLCNQLSNLQDFEDILNTYREFNEGNPPRYAIRSRNTRTCHTPIIDYKPIIPAGAWLRRPWTQSVLLEINYQRLLGLYL